MALPRAASCRNPPDKCSSVWELKDLDKPLSSQVRSTFYGCRTGQLTRSREFSGLGIRPRNDPPSSSLLNIREYDRALRKSGGLNRTNGKTTSRAVPPPLFSAGTASRAAIPRAVRNTRASPGHADARVALAEARYEPGARGCLPGFRFPRLPGYGFPGGGIRPGWSSSDGGSEELPEFRAAARSSLASRSSSSATRAASTAFCAASIAMSWPCSAISASRAASSGLAVTDNHRPCIPSVIGATR